MRRLNIRRGAGILVCSLILGTAANAIILGQPAADLRIVVLDGEDGVNIIDKKTAVKPVVEVRDRNNLPVAGVAVTFAIVGTRAATFGGPREVTAITDATGRATVSQLQPVGKGAIEIQARATYQGQTATTTIHQTNFSNAAEALKAGKTPPAQSASGASGGSSGAAAGGAGASGGMSAAAVTGIVAGAAGATAATVAVVKNRNDPPTVSSVSASPNTALAAATTVTFAAQASDKNNDTLTYSWDFGDGGTASTASPSHTYASAGTYTAKVTVKDGKASVTNQTSVTVRSLTGTWRSTVVPYSQGTIQFTLTLTQSGSNVTGTVVGNHIAGPAGSNSGSVISGTIRTSSPRVTVTSALSGWSGGNIVFSVDPATDANTLNGTVGDSTGNASTSLTRQ